MPNVQTHSDSLRVYLTGATSDGATQTDELAALGNYRSATEVAVLGVTITSPIANVSVDYVAGANGLGSGTLTALDANTLAWTPPGGTQGAGVAISNGQQMILEAGSGYTEQYIRVTRTSATALSGTATLALVDIYNNVIGQDNVTGAQASAGLDSYRATMLRNESTVPVVSIKAYLATLGTQQVTGTTQLGASGSGTIATAGSFADWPQSGFARITDNTGTLREIVYFSGRTTTLLTVPTGGRGQLGTTAGAGAATDTADAVPGIRIGTEAPSAQPAGHIQTIASTTTAPTGITWATGITAATGLSLPDLSAGNIQGLWIHRHVVPGASATPTVLNEIIFAFEAA